MTEDDPTGPVDLPRVRAALARLDALVASGALDPDRAARWLSGDLTEGPTMPTEELPTSVRLPGALLKRAEALVPKLSRSADVRAMAGPRGVSRSTVLRLAVERGIADLEDGPTPDPMPRDVEGLRARLTGLRAELDALLVDLDEGSDR